MPNPNTIPDYIRKGSLTYDFSFANLAALYLETNDSKYLEDMAKLKATEHLINHAGHFNQDIPKGSNLELVTYLLSPFRAQREKRPEFKRNLDFAVKFVAEEDFPQTIAKQYLPEDFNFNGSIFFTFGYDIGVVYGNNCSLNLANGFFLENMNELKYYAVHELHHAGFTALKNSYMPSVNITSYKEMADLIEFLTHLEGMGTYAALDIRTKEDALNIDRDYIALSDSELMKAYEKEYFDIYYHFKNNPDGILTEKDWAKKSLLSDGKRLWYRVGAKMAETIDKNQGRENLTSLILKPSENFIRTYLQIRE